MKKIITVLVLALFISTLTVSFADLTDTPSDWAAESVNKVKDNPRYSDNLLFSNYSDKITREEFAYIGVKVYEELTGETCEAGDAYFADTTNSWVLKAKNHQIVGGVGNDMYAPERAITREQLAVLFVNVLKASNVEYITDSTEAFADESDFSNWATDSIYIAKANGLIGGVGENNFSPNGNAKKEQAICLIVRIIEKFNGEMETTIDESTSIEDSSVENNLDNNPLNNLYSYFDSEKNNILIDDNGDYYILEVSNESMISIDKDNDKIMHLDVQDYNSIEMRIYKVDSESGEKEKMSLRVEDHFDRKVKDKDDIYDYNKKSDSYSYKYSVKLNDVTVLIPNGSGINPYILVDFGGNNKLLLFLNEHKNIAKTTKLNLPQEVLLDSSIIHYDSSDRYHYYPYLIHNDGQYVFNSETNTNILYKLDGTIMPQYISSRIKNEATTDFLTGTIPEELRNDEDKKLVFTFINSTSPEKKFVFTALIDDLTLVDNTFKIPMLTDFYFDLVTCSYEWKDVNDYTTKFIKLNY